jgi:hypothetical protein
MIKIIKGIYGSRVNGRVVPVTSKSGPIKLDEKEEARLVAAGVAEYVEAAEQETKATDKAEEKADGKKTDAKKDGKKNADAKKAEESAPTFGGDTVVD